VGLRIYAERPRGTEQIEVRRATTTAKRRVAVTRTWGQRRKGKWIQSHERQDLKYKAPEKFEGRKDDRRRTR
jgi:hypothetical protein